MLKRERLEITLGLVFVGSLFALVLGLFWAKRYQAMSSQQIVQVHFPSAGGLNSNDAVLIAGIRMGKVGDISLTDDSVLVELLLSRDVVLREGYAFRIEALTLTGEMGVRVHRGTGPPLIKPLPILTGIRPYTLTSIIEPGIDLAKSARAVAETLLVVVPQLSHRADSTLVRADSLIRELRRALAHAQLGRTMRDVRKVTASASSALDSVKTGFGTTLRNADASLASLKATSDTVRLVLASLDTSQGTVARLLRDSTMHTGVRSAVMHLDSAAVGLDSLVRDIRKNPKRYIHVSIF
jgi:phospholipid/cholesterol/gamma-HCH transport system substrate-binding protein